MNRRNRGKSQPQRGKKSFKKNVKSSKFTPKRKSKVRLNKSDAKEIPSTESLGKLQATATTTTTTATAVTTTTSSIASKETVNQHVMTARLLEKDVGITEYISKHEGFSGIIKQRFSDFHVNEIDIDGNVVILTSTSVPELPVDVDEAKKAEDYLKDAVSKDSLEKLKQLLESRGDDSVEIEVSDMSKEDRRKIHMAILRYGLRRLNSNTKERDGKKYITVSAKPDRRVSWPSERGGEYVQFVLHKENMDTMETVNDIAGKLRVKPNLIGYAGTKDRRAKTSQLMSIRRVEPSKLAKSTRNLRGVTLGNYTFKESGLKLGQLCGNRFRIVLRNVTGKDVQIKEAMTSLEEKGFINYFGLQRFGNSLVIPTYEIGRAILQTKWKEAVELILKPRDGEQMRDLSEARKVWWETRDAARALKLLRNPNKHIEGKLLEALSNLGPNNYCDALNKLPNNALSLYMHAYQSLLWNKVVSRRISEFGLHALAGDLVPKEGSAKAGGDDPAVEEDALNVTGSSEETSFSKKDDVREIGEKELTNIKIEDIVVPLPGYDITYPNNVTGEWMQELLKKDGLESMSFRKTLKHFKVGGTYRRLVIRPTNVKWRVMRYSDPQTALLLSDLEMMQNVPAPRDDPDGAYKALVLEFHLPSSCYATMALREILKTDTSVSLQASLNDYHIPKAASKSKENGAEGLGESVTNTLENGSASQEGPSKMKTRRNSSQKSESPSLKGKGKVISEGDKTRQEESRASIEECISSKKTKSSESATNKVETSVKTKGKRTAEHFDAAVLKPKETLKKPKTVENSSQKLEETSSVKTRAKRSSDHLDHSASETEDSKEEKMEVDDVSNKKVRSENDSAPVKTRGRTTPKHVETTADSEEASSGAEEPVSGKKTRSKSKLRDISEGETIEHEDISKTRSRAKTKLRENIEDMRTEAEDNAPIRTRSKGREVSDGNKIPEEAKTEHEDSVPDNPSVRTRSKVREAPVDETKLEGEEVIPCNASLRTRSKAREIPEGGKINDEMKLESEDTTRENPSIRTRSKVREVSDGNKTAEEVKIESDEGAPENLPVRTRSKVREASEGSKSNDEPKLDSEENAPVRTRSKAMTKSRDSTSESESTKDDDLLKNKSERSATPSRAESSEDKPSVRTRSRAISKLADSPALESEGGTEDEDTSSVASSPYKAKLPVRTRSKAKYRDSSLSDNDSAKVEPANSAEEGSSSVRTRSRIQSKLRDSPALDTDGSRDSIEGPDTSIGPVRTRSRISSRSRDSPAPEKLAEDSKQDISESVEERPSVKTRTRSSSKASETVSPHSGDNGDEKLQVKRDDQKIERNLAINENSKKEKAELERDNKRIKLDESVKKSGKILQSEKNKVKEERNENVEDQRKKLSADNDRASNDILGSKETEGGNGSNEPPSLELRGGISLNSEDGVKVQEIRKVLCANNEMKDAPRPFEGNASKGAMEVDSSLGESQKKLEENQKYDELKMEVISTSENHETDLNLIPKITEGGPELEVSEDSRLESAAQNLKQNLASNTNLLSNASDDSSALVRSVLANKTEIKKDQSEVEISANQNEEKLVNVDKTEIKKDGSENEVEISANQNEEKLVNVDKTDIKEDKSESEVEISANQNEDKLVNVDKTEIKKDGSESEVEISANQNEEKLVNVDKTDIKEDKSESEVEISANQNEDKLVNVDKTEIKKDGSESEVEISANQNEEKLVNVDKTDIKEDKSESEVEISANQNEDKLVNVDKTDIKEDKSESEVEISANQNEDKLVNVDKTEIKKDGSESEVEISANQNEEKLVNVDKTEIKKDGSENEVEISANQNEEKLVNVDKTDIKEDKSESEVEISANHNEEKLVNVEVHSEKVVDHKFEPQTKDAVPKLGDSNTETIVLKELSQVDVTHELNGSLFEKVDSSPMNTNCKPDTPKSDVIKSYSDIKLQKSETCAGNKNTENACNNVNNEITSASSDVSSSLTETVLQNKDSYVLEKTCDEKMHHEDSKDLEVSTKESCLKETENEENTKIVSASLLGATTEVTGETCHSPKMSDDQKELENTNIHEEETSVKGNDAPEQKETVNSDVKIFCETMGEYHYQNKPVVEKIDNATGKEQSDSNKIELGEDGFNLRRELEKATEDQSISESLCHVQSSHGQKTDDSAVNQSIAAEAAVSSLKTDSHASQDDREVAIATEDTCSGSLLLESKDISRPVDENSGSDLVVKNDEVPSGFINTICDDILPRNIECSVEKDDSKQEKDDDALNNKNLKHLAEREEKTDVLNETDLIGPCEADSVRKSETLEERLETSVAKAKTDLSMETEIFSTENVGSGACFSELVKPQDGDISDATELVKNNTSKINVCEQKSRVKDESFAKSSTSTETIGSSKAECELIHPKETVDFTVSEKSEDCIVGDELLHKPISKAADRQGDIAEGTILSSSSKPVQLLNEDKSDEIVEDKVATSHHDETITKITSNTLDRKFDSTFSAQDLPMTETHLAMGDDVHVRSERNEQIVTCESNQQAELEENLKMEERLDKNESLNVSINSNQHHLKLSLGTEADFNKSEIKLTEMETNQLKILPVEESCDDQTHGKDTGISSEPSQSMRQDDCPSVLDKGMEIHGIDATKDKMEDGNSVGGRYKGNMLEETHSVAKLECLQTVTTTACHSEVQNESVEIESTAAIVRSNETVQVGNNGEIFSKDISDREHDSGESASLANEADNVMDVCRGKSPTLKNHDVGAGGAHTEVSKHKLVAISNVNVSESVQEVKRLVDTSCSTEKSMAPIVTAVACNSEEIMAGLDVKSTPKIKLSKEICIKIDGDNVSGTEEIIQENISVRALAEESAETDLSKLKKVTSFTVTESLVEPISPAEPTVSETEPLERSNSNTELVSFHLKEVIDPEKLQDVVNSNTLCESRSPKQKAEVDSLIVEESKKESSGVRSVDLTIEKEKPDTKHSIGFSTDNPTETVEKSLSVETDIEKDSSNNSELEKNSTFMTSPDARVTGKEHVMIEIKKASDLQTDQPGDETVLVSTDTVDDRQINSISEEASDISEELRGMGQDTSLPLAAEISLPLQSAELVDKKGASPIEGTFLHEPEKSSGNTDGNERVISLTEKSEHAIENKDEMLVSVDLGENVAEPQERLEGTGDVKEEEMLSSVTDTPKEISCISEVATATSEDLNSKGDTEKSVLFSKGYHLPETEQKAVLKSSEVVHSGSETETGTTELSVEFEKEVKGASLKLSESEKESKLVHQHLEVTSSATEVAHEDKNLGTTTTRETECLTVQSVDLPVERTLAPSVKLSKSSVNANDIISEEENVKEIESTGLFENVGKIEKTSSEDSDDQAEVTTPTMQTDFSNDVEVDISSELHDGALKSSSSSDAAEMAEILKPVSNFSEFSLANCKTRPPAEELEEKQEIEETDESKLSLECSKVVGVDKITSSEKLLQGTKMDEAGKISELTEVNTSNSDEGLFVSMPKVAEKEDETITVPLVAYNMEADPKVSETEECCSKGQLSEISDETSATETTLSSNSLGNKLEENSRSMGLNPEREGVVERKGNISPLEILSVKEIIHPEESVVIKDAVNAEAVGMSKTTVETLIHQTTSEKMEESFTSNSQESSIKDCEDASLEKCQRLEKIKLSKVLQSVKENRNGSSCSEQCRTKNITFPQNGEELKTLESMADGSLNECSESVGNVTYSKEQEGVEELKEVTSSEYATAVTESVMETTMLPEHTDDVNQEDVSSKQHGDTLLDCVQHGTMEMGKVIPTKQCEVSRAEEIAFSEQNEESVVETKLPEESKFTKKREAVLSEQSGIQTDEPVSSEQHEATQTKDINVSEQTNICLMKGVKLPEKSRILHADNVSSEHPESPRTEEAKTSREIEEGVPSEQPMVIRTEEDNHTTQTEETKAVGQSEVTRLKDAIGSEEIVFAEAKETIFSELSSDTQKKVGMPSEQHDISQTFRTKLSEHIEANQVEITPEQNGIALSEESSKQNKIPQVEETKSSAKAIPVQMEEILPPDQTEDLEIAKNSCDSSEITRMERAMSAKQCDVSPMEGVKSPEQCEAASQEERLSHGKSVVATVENVLIDGTMLSGRGINKLENIKPPKHNTVVLEEENQCTVTGMDGSLSPEQEILFSSKNLEVRKVTESIPFEQNKLLQCDKIEPSEKCKINRLEEVVSSEQDEASHEREIVSSKQCEVNQVDNSAPTGQIEEQRMKEATLSEQNVVIQKEESLYAEECKVTHVKEDLTSEEHKTAIQEKNISESCIDCKMPEIMPSKQCSDTRSGGNHSFESTQIKFLPPGKLDQQENPEIEEDTSVEQKENCTSECLDTPCVDTVSEQHVEKKLLFCKQGDASSKRSASCELPVIQEECISSKRRKLSLAEAVEAGVSSQVGEISPMKQEPYEQDSSDLQKLATQSVTSQSHIIVEEVSSTEKPIIQREMSLSSESNEIAEMEESLSSDQCKVTSSEDISAKHKVCEVGANQLRKKGELSVSKFPDHEVQKKGNQVDGASCIEQSEFFQSEKNSEQSDVILAVEDNEPEVMHVTEGISSVEQSRTSSEVEETKPQKSTGESSEQPASSQIGGKLSESITAYQCLKESISSEKIEGSLSLKETESTEQAAVLTKRSASKVFDVSEGIEAPSFSDEKTETLEALEHKSSSEPTDVCNEREASSSSEQSAILVRIEESSSSDLHKVSEGMEESSSVKQPEVSERMEDSSVKQPEISEGMEESCVRQVEFFEKMEESSVEELEVPEGMEESSLEQAKVMQTEDSLSSKQPEILQRTEESSLEQHNDLHRMVESSSDQPEVLQKMESSSSEQAVVFQEVKELVCSELPDVQKEEESSSFAQPVVLQRKEESTSAEKHEVMKKKEESTSFEQPEILPFVEESESSKKPEVLQRQEESITTTQLEILTVAEESSSSNQPEILSRIEDSHPSEQPEVLQRAESSISSSQPEVLQGVEESSSSDPPDFVQEMEESLASEQPEVLERLEESSCSSQTEFLQRMEESSCSDQPKVLERMEESPCSDQPEVLQRMEESSCSDQPEVLQRMEESSCSDQPEVLQRMEQSSCSDQPEVLQRLEESSCCDQPEVLQKMEESSSMGLPEVLQRMEESSSPGQTKVLQRMEESSSSDQPKVLKVEDQSTSDQPKVLQKVDRSSLDQPEVLQKVEESSSSNQPDALQREEKSSSSDQPSVLQKMDDSSCSGQPEVLQRMDESSCCEQSEFLQKMEESSSLDQPEISEKVEELSSSDQPSVLRMVEESSSVDQPEVLQRVEESSVDQPEVLQRVEESESSVDQPVVSQRVEESSVDQPEVSQRVEESSVDQPEVSQRVEESSVDQPEVSQRVEESSVDQPEVSQRVEESSVDQPEVSQRVEESSSMDQPEVSQRVEESSSMDQPEVSQRVEESSSMDQPEVSQRVEESSSMDQTEVSQRVEESSMDQPEVSQSVEESSSIDQCEVSQRVEESSMDQPEVSQRMEESSSMDQPEVSQRVEESSMDQPEVSQRVEESSSMDQPEVSQRVEESSSMDQPEVSQKVEESSSSEQPEVLQRVEESSPSEQPEVLQRVEESSFSEQPEVLQRVEESSSSEQPEVLQRVEESSSSEQPEVLQRMEESSSDQPEVLQRMEELPSSQQPDILQRIEQSSSSEQPEILQKMEESPALEEANILQHGEDSSPLNRPEISQRIEESSASEQHEIVHRIEEYHPEVLHRIEESSPFEQSKVLQRLEKSLPSEQPNDLQSIKESSFPGHFEVSHRMEKSSTSKQPEVLGRAEESSLEQSLILGRTEALSSSEQPEVLGLMEDSSTSEQPEVLQRIEESLSSKQPTILQRKEEKPPSEQPEIFQRLEESSSPEQPEILQKEMPSTEQPQEFSQKIESSSLVLPVVKSSEQGEVSVIESSDKPEVFDKDSSEQLKILERIESSSELPDVSKKTEKFSSTAESEVLKRDGTSIASNLDKMFRPLPTLEHPKVSMTEELQSSNKSDVCIVLEEPASSPKQSEDVLAIKDERKSGTLETFSTSPAVLSESYKESEDSSLGKPECSSLAKDPEPVLGCDISAVPTVPSEQSEGTVGSLEHPKTDDEIEKTMALPEKSEDRVTEVELQVFKEGTCVDEVLSEKNGPVYSDISVVNNEATQSNEMFQKCETSKVNEDIKSCEVSETVEKVEFVASSESSKTDKETKLSKSSFTSRTSDSEQNEVINLIEKVILPEKPQSVEKMKDEDLSEPKVSEVELKTLFSKQQCDVTAATQSGQLENSDMKAEDCLSKKVVTTVISEKPSQTLDQMALSERLGDISPVPEIEKSGKQEANEHNEPQILDSIEVHKVAEISLSDGKKEDGVLCKSLEIHVSEEKKKTLNAKENLDCSILGKVTETVSSPNFNSDFESLSESCTAGQNSMLSSKAVESNDNVSTASQEEKFAISNSHADSFQDVRDNLEGVEQLSANKTRHCSTKELTNKQEENLKCNESDTHSTGTSLDASQPNSGRSAESKELLTSETDPLKSILPGDVGTKEFDSISASSNDTKLELAVKRKADQDDGSSQDDCQITTKKVRLPTEDNEQQLQEVPAKRKADDVDNARSEENKRVRLGETTVTGEDNEEEPEECVLKRKSLEVNCDDIEAKKAKLEASDAPE